ncbi:hypothetical protein [Mucilaginibacter sp.]|uniref:hypothetical protein n=1 Tax=Mucilaginibacter sp. TaxID=1882438 RepID=UPI002628AC97|nr:hypothetical protein [Mucilaginibacter sp.]MDB5125790.1 hypothetical protein [Mucilaginibacter sp.]
MKKSFKIITTIIAVLLLGFNAKSQTLLTPTELIHAYQLNDSSINTMLSVKGYQIQHTQEVNGQKTITWHFQVRPGEISDLYFLKITSTQKTTIRYWIMNAFFYKQFMDNVVKENYKFAEIRIIDKECYSVFKKEDKQLLISQKRVIGQDDNYFEIMIN